MVTHRYDALKMKWKIEMMNKLLSVFCINSKIRTNYSMVKNYQILVA